MAFCNDFNIGDGIYMFIVARNGKDLGVAFRNIRQGPGYAYFPAISNGPREECTANFGNTPFRCVHMYTCLYICDQICQKVPCSFTISVFSFHCHLMDTAID